MKRQKKQIKRTENLKSRVTSLEKRLIESKAKACGITVSDFLRRSALGLNIVPRLTAEEQVGFRAVVNASNNLNALARRVFSGVSALELNLMIEEINQILTKLRK